MQNWLTNGDITMKKDPKDTTRLHSKSMRRANSELLRWSRHFNDVSPFGLLQISVTGLKILGINKWL